MADHENGSRSLDRDAQVISRDHTDAFLRRRRRAIEQLTAELGHAVVDKLHPWVVGDLLYARRETELNPSADPDAMAIPVMVNLGSGRQSYGGAAGRAGPERRRRTLRDLQRSGTGAIARLRDDLTERGIETTADNWLTHSVTANLRPSEVETVAARSDVATITSEKRQFVMALDTSRPLIRADLAQAAGFTGAGVTVAIMDTGVDAAHPALAGVVSAQQDMTGTAVNRDDVGHGTHCAGIVASQDATFMGIAPGAQLLDIRLMDTAGSAQPSWCTAAFTAALTSGADVSSNSWGFSHANGGWTDADGTCVLCTAANNAVAAGLVVVVAAGNEDNDTCSTYDTHLRCPGIAQDVITIAASDDNDKMADFSSVGPTPDNRPKPDVTAPGVDIASCQASGTSLGSVVAPGFINLSGTSMATPHVAGEAALILSKNRGLTPASVKSLVMANVVNIGATANEMGQGRVDAFAAVDATPKG